MFSENPYEVEVRRVGTNWYTVCGMCVLLMRPKCNGGASWSGDTCLHVYAHGGGVVGVLEGMGPRAHLLD